MVKYYTTGQVADMCGVNFRTVIRWLEKGLIPSFRLPGRGDHRISHGAMIEFMQQHNMPLPQELLKEVEETKTKSSERGKLPILIVDDDASMAKAIGRALKRAGFDFQIATTGFEAGMLVNMHRYQLVTLDVKMPGMDGEEVLKLLRQKYDNRVLPVVIVSACPMEELEFIAANGANGIVQKPFDNKSLIDSIQSILN